jgi:prevent-host-death family protein
MRSQTAPHLLEEPSVPRIGLRELKIHVSEVIKDVQETGERYTVTNRGEPVAVIVPYSAAEEKRPMSPEELTAFLDDLAKRVGEMWNDPRPVAELMDEIR